MPELTLYEISETIVALYDEWVAAFENLEAAEPDSDDYLVAEAAVAEVEAALADFGDDLASKAEGYAKLIRNIEAEADVNHAKAKPFLEEAQRYTNRAKALELRVASLKSWLLENFVRTATEKITGNDLSVRRQKNSSPSIEKVDGDLVPNEFLVPVEPKLDSAAIRRAWKESLEDESAIPGLRIVRGEHIRIS